MITKQRFHEIKEEVQAAIKELFDYAATHNDDNYILWLADAEYNPSYEGTKHNPYVLSSMIDYYKEEGRLAFSEFYLNKTYSFQGAAAKTEDHPFWLQLEMMIYSHVWESNKFLKQLYRLKEIIQGKAFPWKVDVPEYYKHTFIRTNIREGFRTKGLKIAEVIDKGFHTSLRNSFLHSEYDIEADKAIIHLHTHRVGRKQPFEMDEISFNEWTERFLYTVLLNYFFVKEKYARKKSVKADFGKEEFSVVWQFPPNRAKVITLYYDQSRASFHSVKATPYVPTSEGIHAGPKPLTNTQYPPLIPKEELEQIEKKLVSSVTELFNALAAANHDQYLCWLFDVGYDEATGKYASFIKEDTTRIKFAATLLHDVYLENKVHLPELIRIQMELLVYGHLWESKTLLNQLRAAARILSGEPINCKEDLQADRRQLINDIIGKLGSKNCSLATIIDQGFHTSIRNAFAHSDYDIDERSNIIYLDTYKEERADWDIDRITFADWQNRFIHSVALDHQLLIAREFVRGNIPAQQLQDLLDRLNKARQADSFPGHKAFR